MNESVYLRIKQYQQGQLTAAERQAFEQQVQNDPEFAEEVAALAAIFQGVQERGDAELNHELMLLGQQLLQKSADTPEMDAATAPPATARRFSLPRWAYAAAAIFLLLILGWPLYQRFSGTDAPLASATNLYASHFNTPDAPTVRDGASIPWQDAYQQKQYPQAIAALQQLLADPNYKRRAEAQLFLGISYSAAGQPQQAAETLRQIRPDAFEYEEAQWYLALACLQSQEVSNAKTLLQNIENQNNHPRKKDAAQILKQLE